MAQEERKLELLSGRPAQEHPGALAPARPQVPTTVLARDPLARRDPERASLCHNDESFLLNLIVFKVRGANEAISVIKALVWIGARNKRKATTGFTQQRRCFHPSAS